MVFYVWRADLIGAMDQCHEKHTVDRVRGVKGSKVLRTRKIKINNWNRNTPWGCIVVKVVTMISLTTTLMRS